MNDNAFRSGYSEPSLQVGHATSFQVDAPNIDSVSMEPTVAIIRSGRRLELFPTFCSHPNRIGSTTQIENNSDTRDIRSDTLCHLCSGTLVQQSKIGAYGKLATRLRPRVLCRSCNLL